MNIGDWLFESSPALKKLSNIKTCWEIASDFLSELVLGGLQVRSLTGHISWFSERRSLLLKVQSFALELVPIDELVAWQTMPWAVNEQFQRGTHVRSNYQPINDCLSAYFR